MNDTCVYGTWWDSYPYSTLSVRALHPQYLALRACAAPGEVPADIAAEVGLNRGGGGRVFREEGCVL